METFKERSHDDLNKIDAIDNDRVDSLWIFSSGKRYTRPWFGMEI